MPAEAIGAGAVTGCQRKGVDLSHGALRVSFDILVYSPDTLIIFEKIFQVLFEIFTKMRKKGDALIGDQNS